MSARHAKIQRLRRLVGRRSARLAERSFVVEGSTLLGEALAGGATVESVFVAPDGAEDAAVEAVVALASQRGARVYDLAAGVLERVAGTVSPQPVLAIVRDVTVALESLHGCDLMVVCVDVRDPGNVGTVLRSAEAAGAGGVVCCDGTVDVTNPKCVRASAGALFHVPVVSGGDPLTVVQEIGRWGMRRLGAAIGAGEDYSVVDLRGPIAFVVGNEAHGIPAAVAPGLDGYVHIPMRGRGESLNVGMATAVLCFEAARQRRQGEATPTGAGTPTVVPMPTGAEVG